MTKLTNCSLGPLRRRKQQISRENKVREQDRVNRDHEFQQNLFTLFLLIRQVGQEVPDSAWNEIRRNGVLVDAMLEESTKLKSLPKEFACGFPPDLYGWFVANPNRAIQIARVIRSNSFRLWWDTRNFLITLGSGYPNPGPYTCVDTSDYLLDWLENDPEEMVKAAIQLNALRARDEEKDKKKMQELQEENKRSSVRFWKKTRSMIVYIGIAYLAIAGILAWKSGFF